MPYTGPADPNLPDNVKTLAAKLKRQGIEVFNDAFARCKAGKLKPPSHSTSELRSASEPSPKGCC